MSSERRSVLVVDDSAFMRKVISELIDGLDGFRVAGTARNGLDAIERIARHIDTAVTRGNDREARWHMMMGALEGGMCMWKGLGPAHALSIPLDTLDLHHGTVVGAVLPHAVRFVATAVPQKVARLACALGTSDAADGLADMGYAAQTAVPQLVVTLRPFL